MNLLSNLKELYLISQPKPWGLTKPIVIQFPVNDICNSRCQMCNIWQQKLDYQISPKELGHILQNSLFSDIRSVGVNGGEPTLRKDLPELVETLFQYLPKLSNISLITNAFQTEIVIKRITEIGEVIKSYDGKLDVMVSLDGVDEIHDLVRGKSGNFNNALKVIDYILETPLVSTQRLGCTIVKDNVYHLHDLFDFAHNKGIYIKYRLGVPHQRLYSDNVTSPFALDFEDKYHIAVFLKHLIQYYEESSRQNFFYYSLIEQLMYSKPRVAGCDWQHRGVTLSSRGEILYCAIQSKILGSALEHSAKELYMSNFQHLTDIVTNKCQDCLHDYMGLLPLDITLQQYKQKIFKKLNLLDSRLPFINKAKNIRQKRNFEKQLERYGVSLSDLLDIKPAICFQNLEKQYQQVLICGWYGTETLGDKAILAGIIDVLNKQLVEAEYHIVSLELYISQMTCLQMIELEGSHLHSVPEAIKIISDMDLVIFGGGPLMAIDPLAEMLAIFHSAVQQKIPTILAGCGVGPLGASCYNKAIRQLLLYSSYRIYRDKKSLALSQSLKIDTTFDLVAEDPAFTWLQKFNNNMNVENLIVDRDSTPILLLALRDWPYHQYAIEYQPVDAKNIKKRFEQNIIKGLEILIDKYPKMKIIPFPMCTNNIGGDDRWFYRTLFRENDRIKQSLDYNYLNKEISPEKAVSVFKSASVILSMRYHSLVFALGLGVPVVSVDYTLGKGKTASLGYQFQVPQQTLDKITTEFIVSELDPFLSTSNLKSNYQTEKNMCLAFEESLKLLLNKLCLL